MARPNILNGGCKPVFPHAVSDILADLASFRHEIEQAEAIADDPRQTPVIRRKWRDYRNLMQNVIDVRIELGQITVLSHDKAIRGCATTICRQYETCERSIDELECVAAERLAEKKNVTAAATGGDAA